VRRETCDRSALWGVGVVAPGIDDALGLREHVIDLVEISFAKKLHEPG
jgi:hypothetical protein